MKTDTNRTWEEYISGYILRNGLVGAFRDGTASVKGEDSALTIGAFGVEVTLNFECHQRQLLRGLSFRSLDSGYSFRFPHPTGDRADIPFEEDYKYAVERFLWMPLIGGWVERHILVGGETFRIMVYTRHVQQRPYCTYTVSDSLHNRLGHLFRWSEVKDPISRKGILLQLEERKNAERERLRTEGVPYSGPALSR